MSNNESLLYTTYLKSTGVSTDTRTLAEGNIFFALKGPCFNGNLYANQALNKGAMAVVLDEKQNDIPDSLDAKVIYVDNVLKSLQSLAVYHRNQLKAKVIGLTGSNGKTTTKELLYSMLKRVEKETYCTKGNLNNHIGVPLTLLSIPLSAKYAIVEMGANQPGDIEELCSFSKPDCGLITNIGKAHLEKLINQEGVFKEKSSLFHSIQASEGVFFLNQGDRYLKSIKYKKSVFYSGKMTPSFKIRPIDDSLTLSFYLENDGLKKKVKTNLFGKFNIENIAASLTVSEYFSAPIDECISAIEEYLPANMRSQIVHTATNTILLDAYNSNPYSLKGSLSHFLETAVPNKLAIIGDMLELGDHAVTEHSKILDIAKDQTEVHFIFVGNIFYSLKNDKSDNFYKSIDHLIDVLTKKRIEKANILIKGSRSIQLEKVMDYLKN